MKRSNVNVIIDEAINSQDYYSMYGSRDFYRGTSFKMAGAWAPKTHYFNDEYIIDFISYNGALLYCLRGHLSSEWNKPNLVYENDIIVGVEPNPYWAFILGNSGKGEKGEKGEKGDIGPIGPSGQDGITPQLKIENGRWMLSMDNGKTWTDIGQATGADGSNGNDGTNGKDGVDGLPGVGIEVRYCLGTTTIYGGTSTPGTTRQPTGWNLAVPTPTEETPYIWFIQARVNYTNNSDNGGALIELDSASITSNGRPQLDLNALGNFNRDNINLLMWRGLTFGLAQPIAEPSGGQTTKLSHFARYVFPTSPNFVISMPNNVEEGIEITIRGIHTGTGTVNGGAFRMFSNPSGDITSFTVEKKYIL